MFKFTKIIFLNTLIFAFSQSNCKYFIYSLNLYLMNNLKFTSSIPISSKDK